MGEERGRGEGMRDDTVSMEAVKEGAGEERQAAGGESAAFFRALASFDDRVAALAGGAPNLAPARAAELLTPILADYLAARQFRLRARAERFSLSDTPSLSHTELCIVDLVQGEAVLLFPDEVWRTPRALRVLMHRAGAALEVIEAVVRNDPFLSARFLVELGDGGGMPSLSFSASHPSARSIPDPDFWETYGYLGLREEIARSWVPWEARVPRLIWRGVTTGRRRFSPPLPGLPDDLRWLPRLDLCLAARRSPHAAALDVALSGIVQIDELHVIARIEEAGLLGSPLPPLEFLKYRGRLVIDSNANDWRDTFSALLMGNCLFLVESENGFRQWLQDALRPWEHYVPVSSDLADLDERVEWFLGHDGEAQAIAARGKALAERLTFGSVYPALVEPVKQWMPRAAFWKEKEVRETRDISTDDATAPEKRSFSDPDMMIFSRALREGEIDVLDIDEETFDSIMHYIDANEPRICGNIICNEGAPPSESDFLPEWDRRFKIEQFWDRPDPPADVKSLIESWRRVVPEGCHLLFDDERALRFIKENYPPLYAEAYEWCFHPAMKSDYFRYAYLYKEGGAHMDADNEPSGLWPNFDLSKEILYVHYFIKYFNENGDLIHVSAEDYKSNKYYYDNIKGLMIYFANDPIIVSRNSRVIKMALDIATRHIIRNKINERKRCAIHYVTGPGNFTKATILYVFENHMKQIKTNMKFIGDWYRIPESISYRSTPLDWRNSDKYLLE
jgi:hypothetical protein